MSNLPKFIHQETSRCTYLFQKVFNTIEWQQNDVVDEKIFFFFQTESMSWESTGGGEREEEGVELQGFLREQY